MKKLPLFQIVVDNKYANFYTYREQAKTAQEAVNAVKTYKDENERIIYVFKQVENWKA